MKKICGLKVLRPKCHILEKRNLHYIGRHISFANYNMHDINMHMTCLFKYLYVYILHEQVMCMLMSNAQMHVIISKRYVLVYTYSGGFSSI